MSDARTMVFVVLIVVCGAGVILNKLKLHLPYHIVLNMSFVNVTVGEE